MMPIAVMVATMMMIKIDFAQIKMAVAGLPCGKIAIKPRPAKGQEYGRHHQQVDDSG